MGCRLKNTLWKKIDMPYMNIKITSIPSPSINHMLYDSGIHYNQRPYLALGHMPAYGKVDVLINVAQELLH